MNENDTLKSGFIFAFTNLKEKYPKINVEVIVNNYMKIKPEAQRKYDASQLTAALTSLINHRSVKASYKLSNLPIHFERYRKIIDNVTNNMTEALTATLPHILIREYQDVRIIASLGLSNSSSLNIYKIEHGVEDYLYAGINNDVPRKYKIYTSRKGESYINYHKNKYYTNEFMIV